MTHTRHYVGPTRPLRDGAYDYALTLSRSDLAWEFLRRNPAYQRACQLHRKGLPHVRRLKNGLQFVRKRNSATSALAWGLCSFR